MADLGGTMRLMGPTPLPLLRAAFASGDFSEEEFERYFPDVLILVRIAEYTHDYLNLVRPAHMGQEEWEELFGMHLDRLKWELSHFSFA